MIAEPGSKNHRFRFCNAFLAFCGLKSLWLGSSLVGPAPPGHFLDIAGLEEFCNLVIVGEIVDIPVFCESLCFMGCIDFGGIDGLALPIEFYIVGAPLFVEVYAAPFFTVLVF